MVAVCVDDEHLDDLGLVWKLLKTILNEYSKLKKNQKAWSIDFIYWNSLIITHRHKSVFVRVKTDIVDILGVCLFFLITDCIGDKAIVFLFPKIKPSFMYINNIFALSPPTETKKSPSGLKVKA